MATPQVRADSCHSGYMAEFISLIKILTSNVSAIDRWLGWADVSLALCTFGFSCGLLYQAKKLGVDSPGFLTEGALLYIACALSFSIAYVAIRRKWRHRWALQVIGPVLIYFTIYGPW